MYQRFGNLYRRLMVPPALNKSKKIITVSEFEKNRICNFFGWPDDGHLVAVYNGVNKYFKPIYDDSILSNVKKNITYRTIIFSSLEILTPKKTPKTF